MSIERNRTFAIIFYALSAIWYCMAMVEVVWYYVYFHIPMFAFFIIAYGLAGYSAYKYNLFIEARMNALCLGISILCFCANIVLCVRGIDPSIVARTGIIMTLNMVVLSYRRKHILWLWKRAKEVGDGDG